MHFLASACASLLSSLILTALRCLAVRSSEPSCAHWQPPTPPPVVGATCGGECQAPRASSDERWRCSQTTRPLRAEWERIWIDDQEVAIARDRFLNGRHVRIKFLCPACPARRAGGYCSTSRLIVAVIIS